MSSRVCMRSFGFAALFVFALIAHADLPRPAVAPSATRVTQPAPRIPAAVFARNPDFTDPQLSPRGDKLLAINVVQGREQLLVRNLATRESKPVPVPDSAEIQWYDWAGDERVLLSVAWPDRSHRDDMLTTRLVVVDLATNSTRELADATAGPEGDDVLYADPDGNWILLSLQRTVAEFPSVFRYDLGTGTRELVVKPHDSVWEWYADSAGVVRLGLGYRAKSWFALYRRAPDAPFDDLGSRSYHDEASGIDLIRLADGTDQGYVLSDARTGRYALYRFDFAKQQLGELVFASPTNDVDDFSVSTDGRRVTAIYYSDERDHLHWLDPVMQARQRALETRFTGKDVMFESRDASDSRFVIWVGGASDPGSYYLYDASNDAVQRLGQVNSELDADALAPTQYVHYRARDGLDIPAYLTLPVGRAPHGLPLVVVPHGGPYYVRDTLAYDPEVQFLANRGYAVLQPNFRGSSGYGEEFYEKGAGQWGRAMQDDLDDGVAWLASTGSIDPQRVCIEGSSYGGYAALWAVTRNPERYRCAASFAGVTDVRQQLRYQASQLDGRDRADWRKTVRGQYNFDLDTVSPLKQVARLRRPVLIAHGDADTTVLFKQSARYRDALKHAHKQFEFVVYPGEGHGLYDPSNFTDWLDRLDRFLARYNPAK